MSALHALLLVLAGVGGGLTGSIAGIASLVSYPALLALGYPPVTANVTNTVAVVGVSTGILLGARPELAGQRHRLLRLGPVAVVAGLAGGLLLLVAPAALFAKVAPWLIGVGSLTVLLRRRRPPEGHPPGTLRPDARWLGPGVAAVSVYGGYFGAAAGVMMLGVVSLGTDESLPRANAAKSFLLGVANAVAAVWFMCFGPVRWLAVPPLALGAFIGGLLGPQVVRRAPATLLRVLIALAGIGLSIHLAADAYR